MARNSGPSQEKRESGLNFGQIRYRGACVTPQLCCGCFHFYRRNGWFFAISFDSMRPKSSECGFFMQIIVRENNVDQALRALKKKLQREGVYREMKMRRHYEKPSEKRAREKAAAIRRARKMERKQAERDGGR
jgi:small subunit ribosomal protein S21